VNASAKQQTGKTTETTATQLKVFTAARLYSLSVRRLFDSGATQAHPPFNSRIPLANFNHESTRITAVATAVSAALFLSFFRFQSSLPGRLGSR
jgi:hypothetical protein